MIYRFHLLCLDSMKQPFIDEAWGNNAEQAATNFTAKFKDDSIIVVVPFTNALDGADPIIAQHMFNRNPDTWVHDLHIWRTGYDDSY